MPDIRKLHSRNVPLVGGIAIYVAVAATAVALPNASEIKVLLFVTFVILMVGIADDIFQLRASQRFGAQIVASLMMIFWGGVLIDDVGNLVGNGAVQLGLFAGVFTVLCTLGVVNAINMIDGADGLSSSLILITNTGLYIVSLQHPDTYQSQFILILSSALLAFMMFNTSVFGSKRKVFLGDAGSTFIGFTLAWLFISLAQSPHNTLSPVSAGWIFGVPLLDTVSVMVGRVLKGTSPFSPGRDHLHHQLIDSGFSTRVSVMLMALVHSAFVVVGLLANGYSSIEPLLFWLFVFLVVSHHFATPALIRRLVNMRRNLAV